MKTVLMIGGGVQQVRAVELARELGYRVCVTDRYADAPCREAADELFTVDGRDTEGQVALALRLKEEGRLDGVFTLTELVTGTAVVAHAAGLPGASIPAAVRCQEKGLTKRRWLRDGISTPRGRLASGEEDVRLAFRELGPPCMLKPVTGFGGKGVAAVNSAEELEDYFGERNEEGGKGETPRWVVEEYCGGSHHDVNGLIGADGTFHPLGVVDRFFLDDRPVEREIRYPSRLPDEKRRELEGLLEEGARSLGIGEGPVKADAVLHQGTFKLLEAAPRLHGPKNSIYLLPFAGRNPLDPTLRMLTGREPAGNAGQAGEARHVICRAILPEPGVIKEISGVERARQLGGIPEILMFKREGDRIPPYRNATHVPGYIFAAAESFEACEEAMARAQETVTIRTKR